MTREKDRNNESIISAANQGLARYTSDLIKRGLNLANQVKPVDNQSLQPPQIPTVQASAEEFFRLGVDKLNQGDYQSALADFNQALKIDPDYYEVYVLRGFVHAALGNCQGVIEDCNQVLRFDPKNDEAYTNRGFARAGLGDHPGAMEDYNQALRIEPRSMQTYVNRGISRTALEDYRGAITDYNQVLQINSYSNPK